MPAVPDELPRLVAGWCHLRALAVLPNGNARGPIIDLSPPQRTAILGYMTSSRSRIRKEFGGRLKSGDFSYKAQLAVSIERFSADLMNLRLHYILPLLAGLWWAPPAPAMINVYLVFGAGWEAQLQQAASQAGVPAFTADEREQMEEAIHQSYVDVWQGYELNFVTSDPGGRRDRVDFGATTSNPNLLGTTTLDFANAFGAGLARIYTANFHGFLEAEDDRQDQLRELTTVLTGTGIHELSHSFGTRHVHAYGTPEITPARYANTAGVQNRHFMATGSTGIEELEREMPRTLSAWSRVVLEVAEGLSAAPLPLALDDAAGTASGTAQPVALHDRQLANAQVGYVEGRLESADDTDWFSFTVTDPTWITAELWSDEWFSSFDDFDGQLNLVGADGTTLLASSDQIRYDGDVFGPGGLDWGDDAFLLNIPLADPGTYYLQVLTTDDPGGSSPGGEYRLLMATLPVPEPSGWVIGLLLLRAFCRTADSTPARSASKGRSTQQVAVNRLGESLVFPGPNRFRGIGFS